jgi:phospholipase/carboxylesterase
MPSAYLVETFGKFPVAYVAQQEVFGQQLGEFVVFLIDSCSRGIVPVLERARYEVRYQEFEGGHVVPQP